MFVQEFDTLKIPEHRFGTQDALKKVIGLSISQALFLLLFHFHMNDDDESERTKLMTSFFVNLLLAVFYRQSHTHTLALLPSVKRQVFCVGDKLKMVKHQTQAVTFV